MKQSIFLGGRRGDDRLDNPATLRVAPLHHENFSKSRHSWSHNLPCRCKCCTQICRHKTSLCNMISWLQLMYAPHNGLEGPHEWILSKMKTNIDRLLSDWWFHRCVHDIHKSCCAEHHSILEAFEVFSRRVFWMVSNVCLLSDWVVRKLTNQLSVSIFHDLSNFPRSYQEIPSRPSHMIPCDFHRAGWPTAPGETAIRIQENKQ